MDDDVDRELADLVAQQDTRPSRESMREVKREAKAREKARAEQQKAAAAYWAKQTGRSSSSSSGRGAVVALAVLALVLGGAAAWWFLLKPTEATAPTAARTSGAGVATGQSPPPATNPSATPRTDPFADTPARAWRVGTAGIVIPKQKVFGLYSKAQVQDALGRTQDYLEMALLNPAVLFRGQLDPVLETLSGDSRASISELVDSGKWTWVAVANRFRPGDWVPSSKQIRTNGRMVAGAGPRQSLVVTFVYVTAHWLRPATGGASRVVIVRREGTLGFPDASEGSAGEPWLIKYRVFVADDPCGRTWPYRQFLPAWTRQPPAPSPSSSSSSSSSVPGFDLADPEARLADDVECYTSTDGF